MLFKAFLVERHVILIRSRRVVERSMMRSEGFLSVRTEIVDMLAVLQRFRRAVVECETTGDTIIINKA